MNMCGLGNLLYHQNEKKKKNVLFTLSELYSHCQAANFPETLKIEFILGEGCMWTLGRALSQTKYEKAQNDWPKGSPENCPYISVLKLSLLCMTHSESTLVLFHRYFTSNQSSTSQSLFVEYFLQIRQGPRSCFKPPHPLLTLKIRREFLWRSFIKWALLRR